MPKLTESFARRVAERFLGTYYETIFDNPSQVEMFYQDESVAIRNYIATGKIYSNRGRAAIIKDQENHFPKAGYGTRVSSFTTSLSGESSILITAIGNLVMPTTYGEDEIPFVQTFLLGVDSTSPGISFFLLNDILIFLPRETEKKKAEEKASTKKVASPQRSLVSSPKKHFEDKHNKNEKFETEDNFSLEHPKSEKHVDKHNEKKEEKKEEKKNVIQNFIDNFSVKQEEKKVEEKKPERKEEHILEKVEEKKPEKKIEKPIERKPERPIPNTWASRLFANPEDVENAAKFVKTTKPSKNDEENEKKHENKTEFQPKVSDYPKKNKNNLKKPYSSFTYVSKGPKNDSNIIETINQHLNNGQAVKVHRFPGEKFFLFVEFDTVDTAVEAFNAAPIIVDNVELYFEATEFDPKNRGGNNDNKVKKNDKWNYVEKKNYKNYY